MVHHVRNAFSCFRSPPDAASLAALLESAAQALLRSGTPPTKNTRACEGERIRGIRHYRFPPLAVRCEKELLEEENAEEMRELLFRAFSSLETFADLLELMNPEAKVEGVVMHTLARELRRIGRLVFKIQDA
ncbi:MAG: glycosyl transferase [Bilophila wadsworthia]